MASIRRLILDRRADQAVNNWPNSRLAELTPWAWAAVNVDRTSESTVRPLRRCDQHFADRPSRRSASGTNDTEDTHGLGFVLQSGHRRSPARTGDRRTAGGGRGRSQPRAKAGVAGADYPGDGRWLRHGGDHAPGWRLKPCARRWQCRSTEAGATRCCTTRRASLAKRQCPSRSSRNWSSARWCAAG